MFLLTTQPTKHRWGDIISVLGGKLPTEVPEEKIQVTISDKDNAADISMNVRERDWVRGLPLVLELDSNWLDFPPQCARASINRTADEPGWNLMPLFSLSDPSILFKQENYLPLPWPLPPTSPCFPLRLVFQPVSLLNRLISPLLIKHDHVSLCALLCIGVPHYLPNRDYVSLPKVSLFVFPSSLYLSLFCFLLSPFCSPQVVSF